MRRSSRFGVVETFSSIGTVRDLRDFGLPSLAA
jgi:hypothetical protein